MKLFEISIDIQYQFELDEIELISTDRNGGFQKRGKDFSCLRDRPNSVIPYYVVSTEVITKYDSISFRCGVSVCE